MFSLICAWTNVWINNRDAGDLRRHRTHYDVTVVCVFREGDFQIHPIDIEACVFDIHMIHMIVIDNWQA